jgi:predicted RNase H-like nuclease (RuvC/YqgF family)
MSTGRDTTADGRFKRPNEDPAGAERVAELLNRVEQQAESLGTMRVRVEELEATASHATAEVRDLKQKLRKERQKRREYEQAVAQLRHILAKTSDANKDLEIERQSVRNLEGELSRAWAEVHALRGELEQTRGGALTSARRLLKRS